MLAGLLRTIKPELAVVDTIASHLVTHVLYPHAWHYGHVLHAREHSIVCGYSASTRMFLRDHSCDERYKLRHAHRQLPSWKIARRLLFMLHMSWHCFKTQV